MLEPNKEQHDHNQEDVVADVVKRMIQFINDNNIEDAAELLRESFNNVNGILQDSKLQEALKEYVKRISNSKDESPVYPTDDDYTPESCETREYVNSILRGQQGEEYKVYEEAFYDREGLGLFLKSREDVRNFVDAMKEFLAHNRSMLKANYLYNPENKEEPLPTSDKILNNCIKLLQEKSPESIVDILCYFYNDWNDEQSEMSVFRDPQSAVVALISCFHKIARSKYDYLAVDNDKFRDLFYYYQQGEEFYKLVDLVQHCTGEEIAICTHAYPDCDAYGSSIALGLLMEKFGAKVSLFNPSANHSLCHDNTLMTLGLKDSSGKDLVTISSECPEGKHFDKVITLDCDENRVGKALPKNASEYLRFDHHVGANFSEAMATCEFIGYLYEKLNQDENFRNLPHFKSNIVLDQSFKIESLIPTLLYSGCFTDTISCESISENFEHLRDRLEQENYFLSRQTMLDLLNYTSPPGYTKKYAAYLIDHNRVVTLGNGLGLVVFDETDSSQFPVVNKSNVQGYNVGLSRNNIRIFPSEESQTELFLSIRSSEAGAYKAVKAAEAFDGGGHENAAGCSIEQEDLLDLEYVKDVVEKLTKEEFNNPILVEYLKSIRITKNDNDIREALKNIAVKRGDYMEALKLSCSDFPLLDVGGIYTNKYIASLALILEEIPGVYND